MGNRFSVIYASRDKRGPKQKLPFASTLLTPINHESNLLQANLFKSFIKFALGFRHQAKSVPRFFSDAASDEIDILWGQSVISIWPAAWAWRRVEDLRQTKATEVKHKCCCRKKRTLLEMAPLPRARWNGSSLLGGNQWFPPTCFTQLHYCRMVLQPYTCSAVPFYKRSQ